MREIGVGLLGLGSVGSGVVKLLLENQAAIEQRLGAKLVIRRACVKSPSKKRDIDTSGLNITTDPGLVVSDQHVDIICELLGGTTTAKEMVTKALENHKHVVTANKALLAEHGEEVFGIADANKRDLYYEAAVGGGIPIIRTLREGLASDRIESLYGILNGTSNYVLSQMANQKLTFEEALEAAQRSGYAEADPTLDISGGDATHKLSILCTLAFGKHIPPSVIHTDGIETITPVDLKFADRFGYVIKPLAIARRYGTGDDLEISARVHPTLVPKHWLLASVPDAKNALYVRSFALGPSLYYGAGAGSLPTAMAVVSDLMEVARNMLSGSTRAPNNRPDGDGKLRPITEHIGRYYMRFTVKDKAGVLGKITNILGEAGVSIAQVIQEERTAQETAGEFASVIVLSHKSKESAIAHALLAIDRLEDSLATPVLLRCAQ